jgi:hypothetical protein
MTESTSTEIEIRTITLRTKDLNGRGNGTQETKRLRLTDGTSGWASDLAQDVTGDWSSGTFRASDRGCAQRGDVEVGAIVLEYTSSFRGGSKNGPATMRGGIVVSLEEGRAVRAERGVADGKSDCIRWGLPTRRRGDAVEVQTSSGEWVEV